ncbi:MAG: hypothetical protein JKY33_05870 [Bacteroidia bacterium]|nr:hypothetical protein [Bacteroidia bacterium]
MEIIVSILIYIGALMGGQNHDNNGLQKGIYKKLAQDNPDLVDFVNHCHYGTITIKVKKNECTLTHAHDSNEECYIHIVNKKNGKTFEKTLGSGCILRLIVIDDLID